MNISAPPAADDAGVVIMMMPFEFAADAGVRVAQSRGSKLSADPSSRAHVWARAFGTVIFAFFGLWMSYRLALRFAKSAAALLASIAIWLASSVPVYLYVLPFSSYAAAMFAAAVFLTCWSSVRTDGSSRWRWLVFGLAGGLAVTTSPFCAALLIVALAEFVLQMARPRGFVASLVNAGVFVAGLALVIALAFFLAGPRVPAFEWATPRLWATAFSTNHGVFVWTPILFIAAVGLAVAVRRQPAAGTILFVAGTLFFYLVAAVATDPVGAVYGRPDFVALTPIFACGLAAIIDALIANRGRIAWAAGMSAVALMILWNLGLMLQWGTGLIPATGPVDFRQAASNQVTVVPPAAKKFVVRYINDRKSFVIQLEGGARE